MSANAVPEPSISSAVVITLPKSAFDSYLERVDGTSTLEKVLSGALAKFSSYLGSEMPLHFSDAQRRELEAILGRNLGTPEQVIRSLKQCTAVQVEGAEVNFPLSVLTRLKSRCFEPPFTEWLQKRIVEWAEAYTGLR